MWGIVKNRDSLIVGINSSFDFPQKIIKKLPVHLKCMPEDNEV